MLVSQGYVAADMETKTADAVEDGCFSGAVRADNGKNFTFADWKRDVVKYLQTTKGEVEIFSMQDR